MNRPVEKTTQPISERTKWRDDFPVDLPQDRHVSRREFTKFLVLISGAFAVGQFWLGLSRLWRKPPERGEALQRIASIEEVPVGGHMAFYYPTSHDRCLLVRTSEDRFVAYSDQCTHLMCPVIPRPDEGRFYCPCHEGYFDLESGEAIAGPPERPLARIRLMIRDGMVYATGMERSAR